MWTRFAYSTNFYGSEFEKLSKLQFSKTYFLHKIAIFHSVNYTISNFHSFKSRKIHKIIVIQFQFDHFLFEHPVDKCMIVRALLDLRKISKKVHVCDSLKMKQKFKRVEN